MFTSVFVTLSVHVCIGFCPVANTRVLPVIMNAARSSKQVFFSYREALEPNPFAHYD